MNFLKAKSLVRSAASKVINNLDKIESLKETAQDLLIKPYIVILEDGKTVEVYTMRELLDTVNQNSRDITILPKLKD